MTDVRQAGSRILVTVFFVAWFGIFIFIISSFVQALRWNDQSPGPET